MQKKFALLLTLASLYGGACSAGPADEAMHALPSGGGVSGWPAEPTPFLAVWQDSGGMSRNAAPFLRVAIWDDGRVLVAQDPKEWGHDLQQAQLSGEQVAQLKRAVLATGVFELSRTSYLVPDAPFDCLVVNFEGQHASLWWDERETLNYGANSADPAPAYLRFKECWKAVNALAIAACPRASEPSPERFTEVPSTWRQLSRMDK
jgi:hypothetical protein